MCDTQLQSFVRVYQIDGADIKATAMVGFLIVGLTAQSGSHENAQQVVALIHDSQKSIQK